jgi:hypothetical protein
MDAPEDSTPHQRLVVPVMLTALAALLTSLALLSEGSVGGADEIQHYQIAHYAVAHPHLLLHHWGKPLFTLLGTPFAALGLKALRLFNVVICMITALMLYRIASSLRLANRPLVIVFCVFAPVYFTLAISGMTEVLSGCVLTLVILMFLRGQYIPSAIVLSFLPFVRTEAIVFFPVFALAYALTPRGRPAIPFMASGFLVYSFAGWPYYGDPLWVINQMPYRDASDIYGRGELLHFVKRSYRTFGYPLALFFVLGSLRMIADLRHRGKWSPAGLLNLLIILLPVCIYVSAHSYAWWRGVGSSLGLLRVTGAVIPPAAIVGLKGFNLIHRYLKSLRPAAFGLIAITVAVFIYAPFRFYPMPIELLPKVALLRQAADWLRTQEYLDRKIYAFDPHLPFFLDIDPYDGERFAYRLPDPEDPGSMVPGGSIIVWDAHFGPNEGRTRLESLLRSTHLSHIGSMAPERPITVLGGYTYEVRIFERMADYPGATSQGDST